ncbi:MAG TPA: galactosyltransferase-related protein [Casimicrobiaceae bacterium]|nr:galactosyltransferase-related protein [Casimicrobiaceae bacterium]
MIPPRAPLPRLDPADYDARLAIVVPYRDRAEHLGRFLPHLVTFFERDRFAKPIPYEIHVAEQAPGRPFNRGAMKNAGFSIAHRDADYVVFHDVDYLPIWADYSRVHHPTSLITWGVEGRGNEPSNTPGCVVAFPADDFVRINGYSNDYWGWGFEDVDLQQRIMRKGLKWHKRDGTFTPLPHAHHGLTPEGSQNVETQSTRSIYLAKGAQGDVGFGGEGLSTLRFRVERTLQWMRNGVAQAQVFHHHIVLE